MGDEHPKAVAILIMFDVKTIPCDWHIVEVGGSMSPMNLVSYFGNPVPCHIDYPETRVLFWILDLSV